MLCKSKWLRILKEILIQTKCSSELWYVGSYIFFCRWEIASLGTGSRTSSGEGKDKIKSKTKCFRAFRSSGVQRGESGAPINNTWVYPAAIALPSVHTLPAAPLLLHGCHSWWEQHKQHSAYCSGISVPFDWFLFWHTVAESGRELL